MNNCYSCDTPFPFVKDDFCHKCGALKPTSPFTEPPNKGYVGMGTVLVQQRAKEENMKQERAELPTAINLVLAAADTLDDRAAGRDTPEGERSMKKCVAIYKAWIGIDLTEEQGWQFMTALKMARSAQGKPKDDDYIDRAGYAALEGECALRDRV